MWCSQKFSTMFVYNRTRLNEEPVTSAKQENSTFYVATIYSDNNGSKEVPLSSH